MRNCRIMILIKFRFRSARRRRSQRNGSAFQPTPIVATLQLLFPPLLPKGRADVFYCFRNRAKKKGVEHNGAKINKQGFSSPTNSNCFFFDALFCFFVHRCFSFQRAGFQSQRGISFRQWRCGAWRLGHLSHNYTSSKNETQLGYFRGSRVPRVRR